LHSCHYKAIIDEFGGQLISDDSVEDKSIKQVDSQCYSWIIGIEAPIIGPNDRSSSMMLVKLFKPMWWEVDHDK
jgi:hypothetical protein